MALVFLFALASSVLFVKLNGALTFGSALAGAMFVGLAAGIFIGLFRLVKRWESEEV